MASSFEANAGLKKYISLRIELPIFIRILATGPQLNVYDIKFSDVPENIYILKNISTRSKTYRITLNVIANVIFVTSRIR